MESAPPIADYGVIGGGRTAALVSSDGSVDWMCWPRFDSPAVFCRLLDREKGGFLRVGGVGGGASGHRYLADTNVLATTFSTIGGVARTIDFLPLVWGGEGSGAHWLARRVEALEGDPTIEVRFRPSFDFARQPSTIELLDGGAIARSRVLDATLLTSAKLHAAGSGEVAGTFRLRTGEHSWVLVSFGSTGEGTRPRLAVERLEQALDDTVRGWRSWIARATYVGRHSDLVRRSALLLKLLIHEPTGGIVAAPTTSLPEAPGGERNWDYRYTWLRDAALTLGALMRLGYHDEAMRFWDWLEDLPPGPVQVLYRVDRSPETPEATLPHLAGYAGSRPVRVGNAAASQRQLDVYGEVLASAEFCHRAMAVDHGPGFRRLVHRLADSALAEWHLPDRGLWEVRGRPQHFLHSKLMCWVALERAACLAEEFRDSDAAERYRAGRDRIARQILRRGWMGRRRAFTRAFGDTALDASALELSVTGFLPASDPRVRSTVEAIRTDLGKGRFLRRYLAPDGLEGGEGAFLACSFWLVDALAQDDRLEEAEAVFLDAAGAANDLGLLAEEVDPVTGSLLGNFPQAYSHLALVRAALNLDAATRRRAWTMHGPPPVLGEEQP